VQFFPPQINFELGSARFPIPSGGQPATNMGGEHIFILKGDPAREQAAWEFIQHFTSTRVQVQWDQATGFTPVRRSVADDPGYQAWLRDTQPLLIPFVEAQQYARARPSVPQYPEISAAFSRQVERVLQGQATPEEALAQAAADVRSILAGP